jgi:iron-sulfur cluster assembly accessory protein
METINTIPITLTPSAARELKKLMALEQGGEARKLRIGVKGGGCSGMSYVLEFDQQTEKDIFFEIDQIPCVMNPTHSIYLTQMVIDFNEGLNSRGFTYSNPNATSTCGCGSSFGV